MEEIREPLERSNASRVLSVLRSRRGQFVTVEEILSSTTLRGWYYSSDSRHVADVKRQRINGAVNHLRSLGFRIETKTRPFPATGARRAVAYKLKIGGR